MHKEQYNFTQKMNAITSQQNIDGTIHGSAGTFGNGIANGGTVNTEGLGPISFSAVTRKQ